MPTLLRAYLDFQQAQSGVQRSRHNVIAVVCLWSNGFSQNWVVFWQNLKRNLQTRRFWAVCSSWTASRFRPWCPRLSSRRGDGGVFWSNIFRRRWWWWWWWWWISWMKLKEFAHTCLTWRTGVSLWNTKSWGGSKGSWSALSTSLVRRTGCCFRRCWPRCFSDRWWHWWLVVIATSLP